MNASAEYVHPGFESVWDLWNQADLGRGGGAFCAYVDGEKVIDVWAGEARPGTPWTRDTTTTLFSSTKGIAAVCAALLHTRGELDVDAPVSAYWPEFAQAGKENAKVRHLLNHSVGVLGLPHADRILDYRGAGWDDYDAIAVDLAAAEPAWEPGTKHSYHAISYGWLVGELIRRITGRTIGTFLREEIAGPRGWDLSIGTSIEDQARAADLIAPSETPTEAEAWMTRQLADAIGRPGSLAALQWVAVGSESIADQAPTFFGSPAGRTPEIAGAGGVGTARDLAALYAMLSMGGALNGDRLLAEDSVELFRAENFRSPAVSIPPLVMPDGTPAPAPWSRWALGFQMNLRPPLGFCSFGPGDNTYGHAGMGGQLGVADPDNRIAIGFVRSHMSTGYEPSSQLIEQLYRCVASLREDDAA
ncbi:serine hydrolase domain-containing protein [Streptomyces muensis]|uniref:Beta-lactamase family protein n=1 Tax=Streptomyces muensis TaxID=1077944 RepID=A0A9X1PRS5_STRM4|nr:serine hydrolase domain-containing protein [Streptomyces muensis]MCF1592322.1 beta-lactamase family protein [Streptomyces muensis]